MNFSTHHLGRLQFLLTFIAGAQQSADDDTGLRRYCRGLAWYQCPPEESPSVKYLYIHKSLLKIQHKI